MQAWRCRVGCRSKEHLAQLNMRSRAHVPPACHHVIASVVVVIASVGHSEGSRLPGTNLLCRWSRLRHCHDGGISTRWFPLIRHSCCLGASQKTPLHSRLRCSSSPPGAETVGELGHCPPPREAAGPPGLPGATSSVSKLSASVDAKTSKASIPALFQLRQAPRQPVQNTGAA